MGAATLIPALFAKFVQHSDATPAPTVARTLHRSKGESDAQFLARVIHFHRWVVGDRLEIVADQNHITSARISHDMRDTIDGAIGNTATVALVAIRLLRFGYGSATFTWIDGGFLHDQFTILARAGERDTWEAFSDRLWETYHTLLRPVYEPCNWQVLLEVQSNERKPQRTTNLTLRLRPSK